MLICPKPNEYFTADLHLGHRGIITATRRPFQTLDEHDEFIIDTWNHDVPKKALVYVLGDFAWNRHMAYLDRLRGKKILVIGNHDEMSREAYSKFARVYDGIMYRSICGINVIGCHLALRSWPGSRGFNRTLHFYGHSHAVLQETNFAMSCDVGWDAWLGIPCFDVLVAKLASRTARLPSLTDDEKHARREALRKENKEWREVVSVWREKDNELRSSAVHPAGGAGVVPPGGLQGGAEPSLQPGEPGAAQNSDVAQSSLAGADDDL